MATSFIQWLSEQQTIDTFSRIVGDVWGSVGSSPATDACWRFGGGIICNFAGRNIQMRYYHPDQEYGKPRVNVIFMHDPQHKLSDTQASANELGVKFQTAKTLQRGSLDLGRKLMLFAKRLKQEGILLSYKTEGKRNDVYAAGLTRAGMQEIAPGVWESTWY